MLSPRTKSALILIAASALSMSASAHTVVEAHSHSGFISGFVHPLFGLDHLAAMVAVGLWSALAARSAGRDLLWGPVGFAAMLLVGAVLGLQGVALPAVEPMIAASLLVTGLLVVSRLRVPGLVAALGVDYIVLDKIDKGATLGFAFPKEMLVLPSPIAIMKGTPNEVAAKKFVDYVLSKDGQQVIADEGTIPVRTDVKSPERFKLPAADEAMKRAIKIDYSKVMNEKEPTVKKFTDIMQKK